MSSSFSAKDGEKFSNWAMELEIELWQQQYEQPVLISQSKYWEMEAKSSEFRLSVGDEATAFKRIRDAEPCPRGAIQNEYMGLVFWNVLFSAMTVQIYNTPDTFQQSKVPNSTHKPQPKDASHRSSQRTQPNVPQRTQPDVPQRNTHDSDPTKDASANYQITSVRPLRDAMSPSERRRYNVHLDFEKDKGDETFPDWKEIYRPPPPSNKYRQNRKGSAPSESPVAEKSEESTAEGDKSENGTDTKKEPPPTLNLSQKPKTEPKKQSGNLDKNAPETKLPETDEGDDYPTGFLKKYRGFDSPLSIISPDPLEFEFNEEFLDEYRDPCKENQIPIEIKQRLIDILSGLRQKIKRLSREKEGEETRYWNPLKIQDTNQMSIRRLFHHQPQRFFIKKQVLMPSPTGGEFIYNLNGNSLPQKGHNVTLEITKKGTLVLRKIQTWVSDNTRAHHTKRFMMAKERTLVLRRGQLFRLTLEFDRVFDSQKDIIRFTFQTGENPKPGNNTSVVFEIGGRETPHGWRAELYSHDGNDTTVWIQIPPTCIVSDWWFSVETSLADAQSGSRINSLVYDHPEPMYVLFNPWCKDDTVHFPMEHLLEEYILNQSGIIFLGHMNRILCKPWNFGQFEDGVLEACLFIIKRGFANKIGPGMADPVKVCRIISTILHAEDNGVLVRNRFTNNYSGGRPPTSWSGSIAILSAYVNSIRIENGNEPVPVKYGQCFVFSGLVTTICRAVGIPCRCVTNYYSGRDNDSSQTIDFNYCIHQERDIIKIDTSNHNFIWSFHVWNDVWMSRPDIPLPYNVPDWQALDATPQISSNGYHSCGPAPLTAVKDGTTHLKFEADFFFAEVNADVLHWFRLDKSDWTVFKVETGRVGHKISTKVPDGKPLTTEQDKDHIRRFTDEQLRLIRQDITDTYKYAEGSWKDKNIMKKAIKVKRPEHKSKARDVEFTLVRRDYVIIGVTFEFVLKMENKSTDNRNVRAFLLCETQYYNGQEADVVKEQFFETILKPSEASEVKLEVKGQEYLHKIRDHCFIKQIVFAKVKETDQIEAWLDDIMLDRPCLLLEPDESIKKGQNFQCRVSFKNPLTNKKLTNCTLSVEGSGIQAVELQQMKDVYHEFNTIITLMPRRSKDIQISFTFHCRELGDITGFTTVVAEKDLIL